MSKQPPPAPTASAVGPCPTLIQISRTPRHWKFTQHHCHPTTPRRLVGCFGFLVGCFGFNGPLRQYFSLYRAVSQREGEREEKGEIRVKITKQPPPAPTASTVGPCPTEIQIVGRSTLEVFPAPSHHTTTPWV